MTLSNFYCGSKTIIYNTFVLDNSIIPDSTAVLITKAALKCFKLTKEYMTLYNEPLHLITVAHTGPLALKFLIKNIQSIIIKYFPHITPLEEQIKIEKLATNNLKYKLSGECSEKYTINLRSKNLGVVLMYLINCFREELASSNIITYTENNNSFTINSLADKKVTWIVNFCNDDSKEEVFLNQTGEFEFHVSQLAAEKIFNQVYDFIPQDLESFLDYFFIGSCICEEEIEKRAIEKVLPSDLEISKVDEWLSDVVKDKIRDLYQQKLPSIPFVLRICHSFQTHGKITLTQADNIIKELNEKGHFKSELESKSHVQLVKNIENKIFSLKFITDVMLITNYYLNPNSLSNDKIYITEPFKIILRNKYIDEAASSVLTSIQSDLDSKEFLSCLILRLLPIYYNNINLMSSAAIEPVEKLVNYLILSRDDHLQCLALSMLQKIDPQSALNSFINLALLPSIENKYTKSLNLFVKSLNLCPSFSYNNHYPKDAWLNYLEVEQMNSDTLFKIFACEPNEKMSPWILLNSINAFAISNPGFALKAMFLLQNKQICSKTDFNAALKSLFQPGSKVNILSYYDCLLEFYMNGLIENTTSDVILNHAHLQHRLDPTNRAVFFLVLHIIFFETTLNHLVRLLEVINNQKLYIITNRIRSSSHFNQIKLQHNRQLKDSDKNKKFVDTFNLICDLLENNQKKAVIDETKIDIEFVKFIINSEKKSLPFKT